MRRACPIVSPMDAWHDARAAFAGQALCIRELAMRQYKGLQTNMKKWYQPMTRKTLRRSLHWSGASRLSFRDFSRKTE